jgi:molecular chaperone GrpE
MNPQAVAHPAAPDGDGVSADAAANTEEGGRGGRTAAAAEPDLPRDAAQNVGQDIAQDTAQDRAQDIAQDTAQDLAEDVAQMEDRWRRAMADLDNLRKRCAREIQAERSAERGRVVATLLPVLDNLDRALTHADGQSDHLVAGVRAVRDQAVSLLAALGYARDEETDVRFDPARHEAVSVTSGTGVQPGTVLAVVNPGYGVGDRQLRPASVVVAGQDGTGDDDG